MAQEDINGAIGDTGGTPYPVQFSVAYPESSNRLTVLVRLILAVPIFVILGALLHKYWQQMKCPNTL